MGKLLSKHIVPLGEARQEFGLEVRHVQVSKFGLWLGWLWSSIFWDENPSWKQTKQLAREGNLVAKKYFVLCPGPLWSTFYYIK